MATSPALTLDVWTPHGGDDGTTGLIVSRNERAALLTTVPWRRGRILGASSPSLRPLASAHWWFTQSGSACRVTKGWFAWYNVQTQSTRSSLPFWLVFAPASWPGGVRHV